MSIIFIFPMQVERPFKRWQLFQIRKYIICIIYFCFIFRKKTIINLIVISYFLQGRSKNFIQDFPNRNTTGVTPTPASPIPTLTPTRVLHITVNVPRTLTALPQAENGHPLRASTNMKKQAITCLIRFTRSLTVTLHRHLPSDLLSLTRTVQHWLQYHNNNIIINKNNKGTIINSNNSHSRRNIRNTIVIPLFTASTHSTHQGHQYT